ncbi:hypothetical protein [Streptomyces sp. NPDC056682]|uniref:hypothetical protein n=1 Tax=Streptomyces sp. NPDC056682 TaxID=3345909 RepID=UPI00369C8286
MADNPEGPYGAWLAELGISEAIEREILAGFEIGWDDFDPGLLDKVRSAFPALPPAGVALTLRIWGHLRGLVALEVYGHLRAQTLSPDKLFHAEITQLVGSLGLDA